MKVFVLSAVLPKSDSTVLLGVYLSHDRLESAAKQWKEQEGDDYWCYFDVVDIDETPNWTNEQRGIN